MIRVLVVDDSRLVRAVVRDLLEEDPDIQVVAEAENGLEAVERCHEVRPDAVVMDIHMPVMDGLTAVERIMAECPTPVLILSATVNPGEVQSAFRAVRAGAFEALPKPDGSVSREEYTALAEELRSRIKLYARVGRRRGWTGAVEHAAPTGRPSVTGPVRRRVVAVAASTGGPRAVQALLSALPRPFPCPLLLVQHISLGFTRGFARWLEKETGFPVRVVEAPEPLKSGTVYMAADGGHLVVRRGRAMLHRGPAVNSCRPSADVLFESVAQAFGSRSVALVLTGMGRDGARGALAIRKAGGEVLVQDETSSVIFGMPKAAIEAGAATRVVPAGELPRALVEALGSEAPKSETGNGDSRDPRGG